MWNNENVYLPVMDTQDLGLTEATASGESEFRPLLSTEFTKIPFIEFRDFPSGFSLCARKETFGGTRGLNYTLAFAWLILISELHD
ncbi:hypothetical protein AAHA92_21770 [Salvia divinorum]|uniref:Uncharacterized protein n=1 Tax=Salvia divinorum TaxID=28513 RepID=A0ABD1GPY5_SALDI